MSMVVQRVDVDAVKAKLASLKNRNQPVVLGKRTRQEVRELSEESDDEQASEEKDEPVTNMEKPSEAIDPKSKPEQQQQSPNENESSSYESLDEEAQMLQMMGLPVSFK